MRFRREFGDGSVIYYANPEYKQDTPLGRREIAINLLAAGDDVEKVANCVKIPLSEVMLIKADCERGALRQ